MQSNKNEEKSTLLQSCIEDFGPSGRTTHIISNPMQYAYNRMSVLSKLIFIRKIETNSELHECEYVQRTI